MRVRLNRRIRAKRLTEDEWLQLQPWFEVEICGKGSRDGIITIIEHPTLGRLAVLTGDLAAAIDWPENHA